MNRNYLIVGEPQESFKPHSDSGVLLALEVIRRGDNIDYCDISSVDYRQPTESYLQSLPVYPIARVRENEKSPFDIGPKTRVDTRSYSVILQRKDPPVDEIYAGHAAQFAKLSNRIIQMNNPTWTPVLSEHLLPAEFPQFSVATQLCTTEEQFISAIRSVGAKAVAKPKNLFSGIGVTFFEKDVPDDELQRFWDKWKPAAIVQPFLKEIAEIGDLRILTMNRKIVGSLLRKPDPKKLLGNLAQGATPHRWDPTPKQIYAALSVAETLHSKGLYLLGLDFIGDYLTEINITCPTTIPGINQVMGIRAERLIVDELEALADAQ